jgi:hypothetical protein
MRRLTRGQLITVDVLLALFVLQLSIAEVVNHSHSPPGEAA